jgi:kynurenine formamidase
MELAPHALDEIAERVRNWGRWGEDDELGTLNLITPQMRARAAASVSAGEVVTLSRPLPLGTSPEVPQSMHAVWRVFQPVEAASELIGIAFHGPAVTHLDALNHIHRGARMYNGFPADELLPKTGSIHLAVDALATRACGRGVLLDVARARGVERLQPGEAIELADLEAAERLGGVEVGEGDLLFVRTGADLWDHGPGTPGLGARCVTWLHERGVALLGSDVATDVMPAAPGRWSLPVHQLAICVMGMPLLDNCALDDLGEACRRLGRHHFLAVIAPLRIVGGTGSPINPLALL